MATLSELTTELENLRTQHDALAIAIAAKGRKKRELRRLKAGADLQEALKAEIVALETERQAIGTRMTIVRGKIRAENQKITARLPGLFRRAAKEILPPPLYAKVERRAKEIRREVIDEQESGDSDQNSP